MPIASTPAFLPPKQTTAQPKVKSKDPIDCLSAARMKYIVKPWSDDTMKKVTYRTFLELPQTGKTGNSEAWIGVVMSVGTRDPHEKCGCPRPALVAVGDTIVYRKWGGQYVEMGQSKRRVLEDGEIYGLFTDDSGRMIKEEEVR